MWELKEYQIFTLLGLLCSSLGVFGKSYGTRILSSRFVDILSFLSYDHLINEGLVIWSVGAHQTLPSG